MDANVTLTRHISLTAWYGYSIRLSDSEIRQRFIARYGYTPSEVLRGPSVVLAGPVKENTDATQTQLSQS